MTRFDPRAREAELLATPWPSPPVVASINPQARWVEGEVCVCDECDDGREAAELEDESR